MGPIPLPARQSLARARDSTLCTGVCVVLVKVKTPELGRAHAQWARSSAPPWASPWAPRSVRRSRLGHGLRGSDGTSLAGSAVGLLADPAVGPLVGSAVGFAVGSIVGNELLEGDHVTFVSYQQGGRRRASNVRATRSDGPGGRF